MTDYINTPEPSGESEQEITPAPYGYEGTETGYIFRDVDTYNIGQDTIAELNRQWEQLVTSREVIEAIRQENETLRTEQIVGSDPRLTRFWEQAQELATRANHCDVFDDMAEALGGPRRIKEYTVTTSVPVVVWVSLSTTVEATDEEQAEEYAYDNFRRMDLDRGDYDINDGEVDWSDAQFEVEES